MKIRIKKLDVTLQSQTGKIQYLWAIIGICDITLIQVYSPTEPTAFVDMIQERYDNPPIKLTEKINNRL